MTFDNYGYNGDVYRTDNFSYDYPWIKNVRNLEVFSSVSEVNFPGKIEEEIPSSKRTSVSDIFTFYFKGFTEDGSYEIIMAEGTVQDKRKLTLSDDLSFTLHVKDKVYYVTTPERDGDNLVLIFYDNDSMPIKHSIGIKPKSYLELDGEKEFDKYSPSTKELIKAAVGITEEKDEPVIEDLVMPETPPEEEPIVVEPVKEEPKPVQTDEKKSVEEEEADEADEKKDSAQSCMPALLGLLGLSGLVVLVRK